MNEYPKVYRNGRLVPKWCAEPKQAARSAPSVISDHMEPLKHMSTGRIIDSKARFRAETRATNCIEIGNEIPKPRQPIKLDRAKRREDIQRVVFNLRNGIK